MDDDLISSSVLLRLWSSCHAKEQNTMGFNLHGMNDSIRPHCTARVERTFTQTGDYLWVSFEDMHETPG
ncbi:hypothetical protein C5167_040475 [Papaver somniferum]|uniref:Uncharacterized protein n=1 Tax=Papaver somniferum TaxID=3469 RepID=A0A4Y7IF78_PAPSO|nr:hypothetical protein C5167_040475 [Papaver somniferum]